jgi:hypothetical protein
MVQLLGERRAFGYGGAVGHFGEQRGQGPADGTTTASRGDDGLPGAGRHRPGRGHVRGRQVAGALQLPGEPGRQRSGLTYGTHGLVRPGLGQRARGDDVPTACSYVDLPGQRTAAARPGGPLPLLPMRGPVPHVKAPGRGAYAQGRLVIDGTGGAPQGGQQTDRVEPIGKSGQVDSVGNPDAVQQPVPVGQLPLVGVDVDDHQPCGAAGDSHSEARVGTPPLLDPGRVQRRGTESMAPAARGGAAACHVGVPGFPAGRTVACRRLAARGKGMNRPAPDRRTIGRSPVNEECLTAGPPSHVSRCGTAAQKPCSGDTRPNVLTTAPQ